MVINLRRFLTHKNIFYSVVGLLAISTMYVQINQLIYPGPIAIACVKTDQKVVALTFDHSWGNKFTPSILDTLKQHNMKVTFFIMGPWAVKFPEVARRIAADGHEIASHGYRHENYGNMSAEWVKDDICKAGEQIKEVTNVEPHLLRPPNGHYSHTSLKCAEELGYKTIIWSVDSLDWKNPGRDVIVERVMKRIKPGAIILLHASDTPVQTAEALPILLGKIEEAGYQVVTVGELLNCAGENNMVRH